MGIDPMLIDQILLWPSFCCPFSIRMVDWAGWPQQPQQPQQSATMRSAGGSVVAVAATVPTNDEVVFLFFCWCQLLAFYARAHTYTNAKMHGSSKANRKKAHVLRCCSSHLSLDLFESTLFVQSLHFYCLFLLRAIFASLLHHVEQHKHTRRLYGCMADDGLPYIFAKHYNFHTKSGVVPAAALASEEHD